MRSIFDAERKEYQTWGGGGWRKGEKKGNGRGMGGKSSKYESFSNKQHRRKQICTRTISTKEEGDFCRQENAPDAIERRWGELAKKDLEKCARFYDPTNDSELAPGGKKGAVI